MLKRLVLVTAMFLCVTMSVTPAIAVYSGITETIENVIQLKAIKSQRKIATESNVMVQAEITGTDSNAGKK